MLLPNVTSRRVVDSSHTPSVAGCGCGCGVLKRGTYPPERYVDRAPENLRGWGVMGRLTVSDRMTRDISSRNRWPLAKMSVSVDTGRLRGGGPEGVSAAFVAEGFGGAVTFGWGTFGGGVCGIGPPAPPTVAPGKRRSTFNRRVAMLPLWVSSTCKGNR